MTGLPVYDAFATEFDNNGLGLIFPASCTVEEEKNGMYELTCEAPIDADGRWTLLQVGRIIKAACPVPDGCIYSYFSDQHTVEVWQVSASSAKLFSSASGGKAIGKYKRGAEAELLEGSSGTYLKARMRADGQVGYLKASDLSYLRTETISEENPEDRIEVFVAKEQLFRIYEVETDTDSGTVTARCQHVFYDLRGNIIVGEVEIEAWTHAEIALQNIFSTYLYETPEAHRLITPEEIDKPVKLSAGGKSFPELLLDSGGLLEQIGAVLYRDNFDFYVMTPVAMDRGVTIRRGKNLLGLTMTVDMSETVTDIIAYAKGSDGESQRYGGDKAWVSPHFDDYPFPLVREEDFDFEEGSDDTPTASDVMDAIERAVNDEYAAGADLPKVGVEVDFLLPGIQEDEAARALQAVHMFDTVRVIDETLGLDMKLTVTGYKWNVLTEQFESLTLGDVIDVAKASNALLMA